MRIMTNGYTGRNLELTQKTGFNNPDPAIPVIILDERGIPFYDSRAYANKPGMFNMPPGKYIVMSGRLHEMTEPLNYPLLPLLPPHRKKRADPESFEIEFVDNPESRCTIDWIDRKIYFDHGLADLPLPNLVYVLLHEYGHRYYGCERLHTSNTKRSCETCKEAEEQCDRYAQNRMFERGYNPSQIAEAIMGTLSAKQYARKEKVVDSTLAVNDLVFQDRNHFEGDNCDCDELEYTDTPTPDWTCEDWVVWHKDLLRAYQDGRLGKLSKTRALEETNRVFAIHWKESAGFSKKFWGTCGYQSGFYNYFREIGYTDHISFIAGIVTPVVSGAADVSAGAAETVGNVANITSGKWFLPLVLLAAGLIGYAVLRR